MALDPVRQAASLDFLEFQYQRQLTNLANATTRDEYNLFLTSLNNLASQIRDFIDLASEQRLAWFAIRDLLFAEASGQEGTAEGEDLMTEARAADANADLWGDLLPRARAILQLTVPAPPDIIVEEEPPPPEITPTPTPPPPPPEEPEPEPEPTPIPVPAPTPVPEPVEQPPPGEEAEAGFTMDDLLDPGLWESLFGDIAGIAWDVTTFLPDKIDASWTNLSEWAVKIWDKVDLLPLLIWSDTFGILEAWFKWGTAEAERMFNLAIGGAQDTIANALNPLGLFFTNPAIGALIEFVAPKVASILADSAMLTLDTFEGILADVLAPVRPFLQPWFNELPPEWRSILDIWEPQSAIAALFGAAALGAIGSSLVSGPIGAALAPLTWASNRLFTPRLVGQDDLVQLWYKQPGQRVFVTSERLNLGIDDEKWRRIADANVQLPFPPVLRDWAVRTGATTEELKPLLARYAYPDGDIDRILATYPELPNVQDVVQFSVREVYDENIVRDFQLDDNFDIFGLADARRLGLADEDSLKYWRAHWDLPSITQTFDMFHRTTTDPIPGFSEPVEGAGSGIFRVISLDRVNELLRVADVMPRWRDPLTRIAFTPFTRVDIRRLFRTGTFKTREEVVRAYLDIGYSEENASIQADFVENLEAERTFDELETILAGQATDGTIESSDAVAQLFEIDVPDRVKAFSQQRIEARVTRARLGELTGAFRQAFRFNRIDEVDIRRELDGLEIPPLTIDHIVNVERTRAGLEFLVFSDAEVKASGRTVPIRRYREGFIDSDQLRLELESLGYEGLEIDRFEVSADLERDTNLRSDTLTAYRSGLRIGRLTESQFRDRALTLGVDPEAIDVYILQDQLKRKLEDPSVEEREVRASGRGLVSRRFREGWTRPDGFRNEMQSMGYTMREIDLYEVQADLEFDLDWKSDILRGLGELFVRGEVTADVYLSRLGDLGMDPGRATTHLARLTASLRPRLRIEGPVPVLPRYQTPTGRVEVRLAIAEFRDRIITEATLTARLAALELPPELVQATVDLEAFRLESQLRPEDPEIRPFFESDEGRIRVRTLTTAFRNRLINGDQLLAGLLELEMPEPEAEALTEFEITRQARGLIGVEEEPVPFFLSEEGSIRMRTLREAFRNELIDADQYRVQLLELEVPENIADALVDFEVTRATEAPE